MFWRAKIKLPIRSLTYFRGPCDERLLKIGKVSVTASDVRNCREKKLILSRKAAEIFIDIFQDFRECTKLAMF